MPVGRFLVGDHGMTCGAGRIEAGEFVYDTWLDGQSDRLVRLGVIAKAGTVDDDDPVLDRDLEVGDPDWLGGTPAVPVETDDDEAVAGDENDDTETVGAVDLDAVLAGNAAGVIVYVESFPDQLAVVLEAEQAGKNRAGLVKELTARLEAVAGDENDEGDET